MKFINNVIMFFLFISLVKISPIYSLNSNDDLNVLQDPLRGINNVLPVPLLPNYFNPEEHPKIWVKLFSKDKIELQMELRMNCPNSKAINIISGDKNYRPSKKANRYALMGNNDSSYFFDFLDNVFLNPILTRFNALIVEMTKLERYSNSFEDPYSLNMLLYGKFDLSVNEKDLLLQYRKLFPSIDDFDLFNNFTPTQVFLAYKKFKWGTATKELENNSVNYIMSIFDKYDFDGSGRLSPHELISMVIRENIKYESMSIVEAEMNKSSDSGSFFNLFTSNNNSNQCQHCFKDFVEKELSVIFNYIDCNRSLSIMSEEIWEGFRFFKVENKKYDLYSCNNVRTSSTNDFVLKAMKKVKAHVNFEEFSKGILLGYANRYVSQKQVLKVNDESLSFKNSRWGNNGLLDLNCQLMNSMNANQYSNQMGFNTGSNGSYNNYSPNQV